MPKPNPKELKDEFVSRCIRVLLNEGKSSQQAVAECISIWEQQHAKASKHYPSILIRPDDKEEFIHVGNGFYQLKASLERYPNHLHHKYSYETLLTHKFYES